MKARKLKLESALVFAYEQYKIELRQLDTGRWTWRASNPGVTGWMYFDDLSEVFAWIEQQS